MNRRLSDFLNAKDLEFHKKFPKYDLSFSGALKRLLWVGKVLVEIEKKNKRGYFDKKENQLKEEKK